MEKDSRDQGTWGTIGRKEKNERLWDYMIIIFNNLLNKRTGFTFFRVLQGTVLGTKYEITWVVKLDAIRNNLSYIKLEWGCAFPSWKPR